MTYGIGNPGPGLGQTQKCGRIKCRLMFPVQFFNPVTCIYTGTFNKILMNRYPRYNTNKHLSDRNRYNNQRLTIN